MLILASASPQRKRILKKFAFSFVIHVSHVTEIFDDKLTPAENAKTLAKKKAEAVFKLYPNDTVLAADTVVVSPSGQILGKAKNEQEAKKILKDRSRQKESVITGYCIISPQKKLCDYDESIIFYKEIDDELLKNILDHKEWQGVAGALRIESNYSRQSIKKIEGDRYNVFGLPTKAMEDLKKYQLV